MKSERTLSCIVSPNNNLYAIGGYNWYATFNSIEFISTININLNTWSYTHQNLTEPLSYTGCIIKFENIFIIGGRGASANVYTDKIHIINTKTNEVSLSNDSLLYELCCSAPILFGTRIYSFGGENFSETYIDKWQYIELSKIPPEEQSPLPSRSPSQSSSESPAQMTTTDNPTTSNSTTKYPTTLSPTTLNPTNFRKREG